MRTLFICCGAFDARKTLLMFFFLQIIRSRSLINPLLHLWIETQKNNPKATKHRGNDDVSQSLANCTKTQALASLIFLKLDLAGDRIPARSQPQAWRNLPPT
jgi:hypothetical protein